MDKYYENKEYVSNSNLGDLLKSPKVFIHNIDFPPEPSEDMKFGTLFHLFLLQKEKFDNSILVFNGTKPQQEQQKRFCSFCQTKDAITSYKLSYSTKRKTKTQIEQDAGSLYETLCEYIKALSSGKELITENEYKTLLAMNDSVLSHKLANKYINTNLENYVEYPIYWEFLGTKVKSKPDKFIINRQDNVLTLIDFKKTDKIYTFPHSFKKYGYARQLGSYYLAIVSQSEKLGLTNPQSEFKIIATEDNGLYETKVINVPESIIQEGIDEFRFLIEKYQLHLQYGFDYNIDYYLGSGDEELILTI